MYFIVRGGGGSRCGSNLLHVAMFDGRGPHIQFSREKRNDPSA